MKKIGKRLRDLRRSKKMKQEEIAKLLNIKAAAYSKIENQDITGKELSNMETFI